MLTNLVTVQWGKWQIKWSHDMYYVRYGRIAMVISYYDLPYCLPFPLTYLTRLNQPIMAQFADSVDFLTFPHLFPSAHQS